MGKWGKSIRKLLGIYPIAMPQKCNRPHSCARLIVCRGSSLSIIPPEQIVPYSLESILASERIPSLPEVAARIVEIARDPDPNYDQLIETIRTDPAIAGRILKTANSALLGMRTRANSIEQAVPRLGTTMVRTLVL
jgi:hypothetical protein